MTTIRLIIVFRAWLHGKRGRVKSDLHCAKQDIFNHIKHPVNMELIPRTIEYDLEDDL